MIKDTLEILGADLISRLWPLAPQLLYEEQEETGPMHSV